MIRVGLGYDIHQLVENRKLILGGIEIPFQKGCLGNSDGDALFHAITDSLLGASGLGDIGMFFPPDDPQWSGADSAVLLNAAWQKAKTIGWHIENIDCVIALEKPKFLPHRQAVRENIAKTLGIQTEQIFVKAKTGEGLSDIGESKAIAVWAVCLLSKNL